MDNECRVPVCAAVDADDARIISYSDGAREGTGGLALWRYVLIYHRVYMVCLY